MNDVNEMWSSPWRKLQKNLASGFKFGGSGQDPWICNFAIRGESQVPGAAAHSWLVRARRRR
jgi:hypothetical protein